MNTLGIFLAFFIGVSHAGSGLKSVYSVTEAQKVKTVLSKSNIKNVYKNKGIAAAVELFFKTSEDFAKRTKNLKTDTKGLKLQTDNDKFLLIHIVKMAQFFADEIDGSSMHYYGLSLLYKEVPKDFDWAIENSSLSSSERLMMKDNLKAQLTGDN